jgi:hypothetical protein
VDWGTGWHSDLFLHKHSTSIQSALRSGQPRSFEHSDFQQQESRNCWDTESLALWGTESLPSRLQPRLKLRLSMMEHKSS